jgi:tripartite-type tricarboxylate transporter receptor subunit TctC
MRHRLVRLLTVLSLVAGLAPWASAAPEGGAFPSRDVQLVVPNEPGGGLDLVARLLAKGIAPALAHPVVVINRSGASGNVGTLSVARSEPDGHTLLLTGVGHLVSPLLHGGPGYEPLQDFQPVAKIASAPNVLVVHESLKGLSLAQLLADPRSRSAGLSFASSGYGHSSHLAAEVFMARTGARWLHVPYRGTGPASRAVIAGEVQIMFVPAGSVQNLLATGRAVAVAVAHAQRLASLPSIPTLVELGVQEAEFSQWYGLFAPAGTPAAATRTLQDATLAYVAADEVQRHLRAQGLEPDLMDHTRFAAFLAAQSRHLGTMVKKVKVEGATN